MEFLPQRYGKVKNMWNLQSNIPFQEITETILELGTL